MAWPVIVLGHRGVRYRLPENTLAGLTAAFDLGVDGVEFDVRLTRDGVAVLHHDPTLERLNGLPDRIADLEWAELSARTATCPAPVAALADVLPQLLPRGWLDIEIKEVGAERAVLDALAPYSDLSRVALSSFLPEALASVQPQGSRVARWLNAEAIDRETVRTAHDLGVTAIIVPAATIHPEAVQRAQATRLGVGCWGVDRADEIDRLADLGLAVVIPDLPLRGKDQTS